MLNYQIEEFWLWFDKSQKHLGEDIHNHEFLQQIDTTITNWGLGWEIGPGISKLYSITISPNGNSKLVDKVNAVTHQAPLFDNWEVFSFKQAKKNWQILVLDNSITVECSGWAYCLLRYPDDEIMIEIEVKADNIASYPAETKNLIVDLVLTNLLGEEIKMKSLSGIVLVDEFETNSGISNIKHLPAHLVTLK